MKNDLTIDWNVASNVPSIVQEIATKDFMSDMEYGFYMARPCDSRRNATGNGDKPPPIAANDADHIEHCVHVLVKNLQSIRCESRWENLLAELKTCHFDLLLIFETWRGEKDANFITEKKHILFIFFPQGICSLYSSMTSRRFRVFCVYLPTAWDADGAVEQMYDVLKLLVDAFVEAPDIPIVGGDFNGCIGLLESDDLTLLQHVGPGGMGQRNARGTMLMKLIHWTLQSNFYIFNKNGSRQGHESCPCRRVFAGNFVQVDFVIGHAYFSLKKTWHNCCNDHRCVHCKFSRMQPYTQQYRRKHVLKWWKPIMDENGEPSAFQTLLETKIDEQNAPTFDAAEKFFDVKPLWPLGHVCVTNLHLHRRTGFAIYDKGESKRITMQLANFNVPNSRMATLLQTNLAYPARWKDLQRMSSYSSQPSHRHPALDEFAMMLENCSLKVRKRPCNHFI